MCHWVFDVLTLVVLVKLFSPLLLLHCVVLFFYPPAGLTACFTVNVFLMTECFFTLCKLFYLEFTTFTLGL